VHVAESHAPLAHSAVDVMEEDAGAEEGLDGKAAAAAGGSGDKRKGHKRKHP
jgi:hypothetical protein